MAVHFDVIVCGAGPSGATAAARAATRGLTVALIDRAVFPRHKPCGGGMPMTVGSVLRDLAPEAFVEARVHAMRHTWLFQRPILAPINRPGSPPDVTLWMAKRSVFDTVLVRRAERAGATLFEGVGVRSIERQGHGVVVRGVGPGASTFSLTARHVIGADGANSITAKAVAPQRKRTLAIAMEVEQPHRWGQGSPDLQPDVLHLDYGVVPGGYAWAFPKGDHVNVGAGILCPRQLSVARPHVRGMLQRAITQYMDALGVRYCEAALQYRAHPLPLWSGAQPVATSDGRILLVGDAAGLITPLFGDGILSAVKSGIVAADALADEAPLEYTYRMSRAFRLELNAARRLSTLFYRWTPLIYNHAITRPAATRTAARLICQDTPFVGTHRHAIRELKRVLTPSVWASRGVRG